MEGALPPASAGATLALGVVAAAAVAAVVVPAAEAPPSPLLTSLEGGDDGETVEEEVEADVAPPLVPSARGSTIYAEAVLAALRALATLPKCSP